VIVSSKGYSRIEEVIGKGADVNAVYRGRTALIGYIESLDLDSARSLVLAGVNPSLAAKALVF
jgi:hypothetical protein